MRDDIPTSPRTKDAPHSPSRTKLWIRRIAFALTTKITIVCAVTLLLTYSNIVGWFVALRLSETAGGDVTIESLHLKDWDSATIEGLSLRAPGWEGAGGTIARIERIEVEFDLLSLFWGQTRVHDLAVHGVEVTLVEDLMHGSLYNFQRLTRLTSPSPDSGDAVIVERAVMSSVKVSFQQLRGAKTHETSSLVATATLEPSPDDASRSLFDIKIATESIHASGWWNQSTLAFDVSVEGLSIGDRLALILPRPLRALATQIDAQGTVTLARLRSAPGSPMHGLIQLADVRATLPTDGFDDWVRYERGEITPAKGYPQFKLRSGTVELTGSKLEFKDLDFELVNTSRDDRVANLAVRASLVLDFASMTREDFQWEDRAKWARHVRDCAQFDLRVMVPHFSLGKTALDSAIEVPRAAAEFMRSFGVTELTFDLGLTLARPAPTLQPDGSLRASPLESSATLVIADGQGAFEEFPYPLNDVEATVRFSGMNAEISDLRAVSAGGDKVIVHGTITNMGPAAGVDLTISCGSGPIDDALINSFPDDERTLIASLFWHDGFTSLQAAGVLFDEAQVTAATAQLPQCDAQLRALTIDATSDAAQIAEISAQAGRLRRIIDQGAFTPGGRVAFTLNLARAQSVEAEVVVTGNIRILHADLLPMTFPYPVRATGGELVIRPDRIEFAQGVSFHTLNGAQGMFDGTIDLAPVDGLASFQPRLSFALNHEQLNPLFVMAIPPAQGELLAGWPGKTLSKGGQFISQFDVHGDVSIEGTIASTPTARLDVTCDIRLEEGSIHPVEGTGSILNESDLSWPLGFGLDDCTGSFHLDDSSITIHSFTGSRRDGRIEAHGSASLDGSAVDIEIDLDEIDLADYAINLLPHDERAHADELWERFQPRGRFDAQILLAAGASGGVIDATLTVTPRSFGITTSQGPVEAHFDSGTLEVHGEIVTCQSLTGTIGSQDGLQAELCLHGHYGGVAGDLDVTGSVRSGLIHGPVIREISAMLSAAGATSLLDQFSPEGIYDADFSYAKSAGAGVGAFEIDAWIHSLSLGDAHARLELAFDTPAHIHARSEALEVSPCRATFVGGSLESCGWLSTDQNSTIDQGEFAFELEAIGTGSHVIAALPPVGRTPLAAIGFTCNDILRATTTVRLSRNADLLHSDVSAEIALMDAGIAAGIGVSKLAAKVLLDLSTDASGTTLLARIDHGSFSLANRPVTEASAVLRMSPGDSALHVEQFAGSMGDGKVAATARVEIHEPYTYESDIALSGVPLAALTMGEDDDDPSTPAARDVLGLVDGRVGVGGDFTGLTSRRGRGAAVIQQAELARLPIAVALLQITQLSLAFNSVVERGDFRFTIDQDVLNFQKFNLSCKDVILDGHGWLNIESTELALRLCNRGTVPIVSDILGGVSNQIFQLDVRGTMKDPRGSIAPLPSLIPAPSLPMTPSTSPLQPLVRAMP